MTNNTLTRDDIRDHAEHIIRAYILHSHSARADIVAAVEEWHDDPDTTATDKARVVTRIEMDLGMLD